MSSHKIYTSADVKFNDNVFPTNSGDPPLQSINEINKVDDPFRDVDESDDPEGVETKSSNAESNDDTSCSDNELDAKPNNEPEVYDRRSLPPTRSQGKPNDDDLETDASNNGNTTPQVSVEPKPHPFGSGKNDDDLETDASNNGNTTPQVRVEQKTHP